MPHVSKSRVSRQLSIRMTAVAVAAVFAFTGATHAAIVLTNTGTSTVFNSSTSAGTISGDKGGTISNWALNGGNAVVFLISQEESANGWTGFTASYGSEAMTVVETITASARHSSAIAYIINPVATTANLTFGWTSSSTSSEGVYTALSLSNVASVLGSTSRDATTGATLTLNYTSTVDGGFVVGAGNNNSSTGGSDGAPASSGNLDTNLFRNIASGNTGVLHVYGDIPTAGNSSSSIGDLLGANSGPNLSSAIVAFEAIIPEPASLALGLVGLTLIAGRPRRK